MKFVTASSSVALATLCCLLGPLTAAPALAVGAAPPPAGFEPASVSFFSAQDGFVLGTSHCGHPVCTALLATADGGKSWALSGRPAVALNIPGNQHADPSAVREVAFANSRDGWLFGPGLWSTNDGGANWRQAKPGGPIYQLATYGNEAFALVASCNEAADSKCSPTEKLERSAVGSSSWATVPGLRGTFTAGSLAGDGPDVWVAMPSKEGTANSLWHSTDSGASWQRLPDKCFDRSQGVDIAALAATNGSRLFELCAGNAGAGQEGKSLRLSTDSGTTSAPVSSLPLGGLAVGMAAADYSDVAVTAVSGASVIYHSPNGGKSWKADTLPDGGAGLDDLQFRGPSLGAVVEGWPGSPAGPGPTNRLLLSHDGGRAWAAVPV